MYLSEKTFAFHYSLICQIILSHFDREKTLSAKEKTNEKASKNEAFGTFCVFVLALFRLCVTCEG